MERLSNAWEKSASRREAELKDAGALASAKVELMEQE